MPTLELTTNQVLDLFRQLPGKQREEMIVALMTEKWPRWMEMSKTMQDSVREAAVDRGHNWDEMTEEEREDFIQDLCEED